MIAWATAEKISIMFPTRGVSVKGRSEASHVAAIGRDDFLGSTCIEDGKDSKWCLRDRRSPKLATVHSRPRLDQCEWFEETEYLLSSLSNPLFMLFLHIFWWKGRRSEASLRNSKSVASE